MLLETWYVFMYQLLDLDELKSFLAYGELPTLLLIKVANAVNYRIQLLGSTKILVVHQNRSK